MCVLKIYDHELPQSSYILIELQQKLYQFSPPLLLLGNAMFYNEIYNFTAALVLFVCTKWTLIYVEA